MDCRSPPDGSSRRERLVPKLVHLLAATTEVVRKATRIHGPLPVVLTGGCFQNPRLSESLASVLGTHSTVHLHHEVPPGDGGLALGQAVVAAAVARQLAV